MGGLPGLLPDLGSVVVVCAHPDDESFGPGAILHALAGNGTDLAVLCFTHGEASTLRGVAGDLGVARAAELAAASRRLGVGQVELLGYPDGALAAQPRPRLAGHVARTIAAAGADALLVFDHGGVTGHPDHQAATDAALAAAGAHGVPVVAWAIPAAVAAALNGEFGTGFVGRHPHDCELELEVDRAAQLDAIRCHASQSAHNPVLRRRLELQQGRECLRVLHPGRQAPRPLPGS
jgi:LmbE family N-acetylglucosaminyl deacetylase